MRGEIEQDRARFEQRDRLAVGAVGVDDRRDLVVRVIARNSGCELLAGADVDRNRPIRQPALLEHHVDLVAIGRGPRYTSIIGPVLARAHRARRPTLVDRRRPCSPALRSLFAKASRGGTSEVAAWARQNAYTWKREKDGDGFAIDGPLDTTPWRLEWGRPQRPYIARP